MTMIPFPLDLLKPRHAILSGEAGNAALEILLCPFYWQGELVDTSIRLDGIALPEVTLRPLLGQSFEFPLNPDENAIDGSIYLDHRHHPVDVNRLVFNRTRQNSATVVIKGCYVFEHEGLGEYANTPFTFGVAISASAI